MVKDKTLRHGISCSFFLFIFSTPVALWFMLISHCGGEMWFRCLIPLILYHRDIFTLCREAITVLLKCVIFFFIYSASLTESLLCKSLWNRPLRGLDVHSLNSLRYAQFIKKKIKKFPFPLILTYLICLEVGAESLSWSFVFPY